MTANNIREITFVMNFDDYENCPEELKKYIMTNGREPLNGVYTSTIAEGKFWLPAWVNCLKVLGAELPEEVPA